MPGGDLWERLCGAKRQPPLSWRERLQIALTLPKVPLHLSVVRELGALMNVKNTLTVLRLEYLHCGCYTAIFHRAVKSSNILLNDKLELEAKVADFGLSKVTDQSQVMTTGGEGDPGILGP